MQTTDLIKNGLSTKEVLESKRLYGDNSISIKKKNNFFRLLLSSFSDPIIKILLIALCIKILFIFNNLDLFETLGIVIAIFLASFISTISEIGSEKAFEKLQEDSSRIKCRVKRNKQVVEVDIDDIVKGDLIILQSGDKIPCDGVIINGDIYVDESQINGESKEKNKKKILTSIKEENKVYRGSIVCSGSAYIVATKIGNESTYGKLALELQQDKIDSPLKIRLTKLAKTISYFGYIGAFLVFTIYLVNVIIIKNNFEIDKITIFLKNYPLLIGHILQALTLSITVIVVAVPEGLPMMITLVLSSNMKKMLKDKVLVRKLNGIETAGNINILFTDKTGTLTKGALEVVELVTGELRLYKSLDVTNNNQFIKLLNVSLIYNNESYINDNLIPIGGNMTDRALLSFANNNIKYNYNKISQIEFNSFNKYSVTNINYNSKTTALIKGAYEKLLPMCSFYYDLNCNKKLLDKKKIEDYIINMTRQSIRVIMFCVKENAVNDTNDLNNLILLAVICLKDEVREEAKTGVELVKSAGINTIMITGDNKDTAISIAKEVGILETNLNQLTITSDELNKLTDAELKSKITNIKVVARALPQDKSRLVRVCQEMNYVVGMTGDGVNDAPALKKSDVGFSMGSGTEVSKEASDIVILDDNFLSISKAILYGRTIFKNIRKFIVFQLSVNICAVLLSIIGPFINIDAPVTVIQMLWINMVMDTFASLAFAYEPPLLEYMKEKPKNKTDNILNLYMKSQIFFTGFYSFIFSILFLKLDLFKRLLNNKNNLYFMTAFFALFIFMQIFNSFNARTNRLNLLSYIYKNKAFLIIISLISIVQIYLIYYGGSLFRTVGLNLREFIIVILLAVTIIPFDMIRKMILRMFGRKGTL